MFQVMGFHWKLLGYRSAARFVELMNTSEGEHLGAFVKFVDTEGLARFLRKKDWAGFARRYNGKNYRINQYDTRLAKAYEKFRSRQDG
jgi:hypothetical protein